MIVTTHLYDVQQAEAARSGCGLRYATSALLFMRDPCGVLARAIAVVDALACCQERFPRDARGIVDP